ncbi:hypothetical protein N7G274_005698 [Stereocaulon virgatum]|uniref:Uncharacterized protein n=1 Tax=Stereocaulon virgatum TaxID=373712 RepID=A0ABR4A8U3_9LECA
MPRYLIRTLPIPNNHPSASHTFPSPQNSSHPLSPPSKAHNIHTRESSATSIPLLVHKIPNRKTNATRKGGNLYSTKYPEGTRINIPRIVRDRNLAPAHLNHHDLHRLQKQYRPAIFVFGNTTLSKMDVKRFFYILVRARGLG